DANLLVIKSLAGRVTMKRSVRSVLESAPDVLLPVAAALSPRFCSSIIRVAVVLATGLAASASAAPVVYNGFTQNPTCPDNDPTANMCATKFAPTGAALTAHDNFFGSLTSSVATNDFESIAANTLTPLALNFGFAGTATLTGEGHVEAEDAVAFTPV